MEKEGRSAFLKKPNVPFACATGQACRTVDAQGREDRSEFDAAGRVAWTIQNFCDGSTTGEFTYVPDGGIATQTMKNSATGVLVQRVLTTDKK